MKAFFKKLFYLGLNSEVEFQRKQEKIRNDEWNSIRSFIPKGCVFLDVGCGTGYSMYRAVHDCGCLSVGVDPRPLKAGVLHDDELLTSENYRLECGIAENLPIEDRSVDCVYSSHALEHVQDEEMALMEMARVVKREGRVIIGVPTATMALIRLFSLLVFETHRNLLTMMRWPFNVAVRRERRFLDLIIPRSHGQPNRTIFFDLVQYRSSVWRSKIGQHFEVIDQIYPSLYSFPEYGTIFRSRKLENYGSSVFFICKLPE